MNPCITILFLLEGPINFTADSMSIKTNSIYGIYEFKFNYTAGRDWEVQCRFSALPGNPVKIMSVKSADGKPGAIHPDHWFSFIRDMGLEKDFKTEALSFALYNYSESCALSGRRLTPSEES